MIDNIDQQLIDWVGTVLKGEKVSLAKPSSSEKGRGIFLYLMELNPIPKVREQDGTTLQCSLRYLVTAWAEEPSQAHQLLGKLAFAAMENTEFEVDFEPLSPASWTAFGVEPRPSFFLRLPVRQHRAFPPTKLVTQPLVLHTSPIHTFTGVVYGPEETPIMGAKVEVPALQLSTQTDSMGQFYFPGLPKDEAVTLRVRAKGQEVNVTIDPMDEKSEPLVIPLTLEPGKPKT